VRTFARLAARSAGSTKWIIARIAPTNASVVLRNAVKWRARRADKPSTSFPTKASNDGETARMNKSESHHRTHLLPYLRFAAMIVSSTVIMYAAMYLNTYAWDHVFFSETRAYMSLLMGAIMAVVMLTFMLTMHPDWRINIGIYVASVAIFALALWLVRSQRTVDDVSYMRAMIPHHSIAILTSERAQISDPRVRNLADQIIKTQRKEIAEMRTLIDELKNTSGQ
jgi:hypothetical protein